MEEKKKLVKRDLLISKGCESVISHSVLTTYHLGQRVGRFVHQGVIALFGDLGSGKTVFSKGVASSLGVKNAQEEVISPSFMIIREHSSKIPFYHVDLYRIGSPEELYFLNLEDYFYREGVTLIEWADRAVDILPKKRLEVYFEVLGKKRRKIELRMRNLE